MTTPVPPTQTEAQRGTWQCPACVEPEDREWCDHEAEWVPLAKALAVNFGWDVTQIDSATWGSFLNDAGVLFREAGPGPDYIIVKLENGWHNEWAFAIDGRLIVTIGEGGKDCPAEPEIAAKLPDGMRFEVVR